MGNSDQFILAPFPFPRIPDTIIMATAKKPYCKSLVLDAGPLLSLSPLRGIAESYYTVPQVLAELKDKNAKEHLERLGLNFGIKIEVKNPDPASLASGVYILHFL